jgi:type I restriction enzyme M protein
MRKSLGDKRNELTDEHLDRLMALAFGQEESEHVRVFDNEDFGYRRITVERPLRLNFQVCDERIERLKEEKTFVALATSRKRDPETKAREEEEGREEQAAILAMLATMPDTLYRSRKEFEKALKEATKDAGLKLAAPTKNAILSALSERDEEAAVCTDAKGNPEPDSNLRDYENVPLKEDIQAYFAREVLPHVPDAWINGDRKCRDEKDKGIGIVGYEINFNRYFYRYEPPRPLEEIDADIRALEAEILQMLGEVTR